MTIMPNIIVFTVVEKVVENLPVSGNGFCNTATFSHIIDLIITYLIA